MAEDRVAVTALFDPELLFSCRQGAGVAEDHVSDEVYEASRRFLPQHAIYSVASESAKGEADFCAETVEGDPATEVRRIKANVLML